MSDDTPAAPTGPGPKGVRARASQPPKLKAKALAVVKAADEGPEALAALLRDPAAVAALKEARTHCRADVTTHSQALQAVELAMLERDQL